MKEEEEEEEEKKRKAKMRRRMTKDWERLTFHGEIRKEKKKKRTNITGQHVGCRA